MRISDWSSDVCSSDLRAAIRHSTCGNCAMTTIQQVLDSKGHDVLTVRPDDTVLHALEQMASRNVGAVIVTENAEPVGIFTERDYARSVILKGRSSTTTTVRDVMSTEMVCLQPEQTVDECKEIRIGRAHV